MQENLQIQSIPTGYLQMLPYHPLPLLQPTINLSHNIFTRIRIPIRTRLRHHLRNLQLIDIRWSLHECHEKPLTQMKRDMTMEWPRSRVIGIELKHQVAESRHILSIPTLWILRTSNGYTIPRSSSVMENVEIVPV